MKLIPYLLGCYLEHIGDALRYLNRTLACLLDNITIFWISGMLEWMQMLGADEIYFMSISILLISTNILFKMYGDYTMMSIIDNYIISYSKL